MKYGLKSLDKQKLTNLSGVVFGYAITAVLWILTAMLVVVSFPAIIGKLFGG